MDDLTYNIQRRTEKDIKTTDAWLRSKGINIKSFNKTKPVILQAQKASEDLLTQHSAILDNTTKKFLKNFQQRYRNGKKRDHISEGDCYRVLNLSSRVKRGQYKNNRQLKNKQA